MTDGEFRDALAVHGFSQRAFAAFVAVAVAVGAARERLAAVLNLPNGNP